MEKSGPAAKRPRAVVAPSVPRSRVPQPAARTLRASSTAPLPTRGVVKRTPSPMEQRALRAEEELQRVRDAFARLQLEHDELSTALAAREKLALQLQLQLDDKDARIDELTAANRELHEAVLTLKGNIRVMVRVRASTLDVQHLRFPSACTIQLLQQKEALSVEVQRVFQPHTSQTEVFAGLRELIESFMYGHNVAIVAYGQTGAGKTYTMRGSGDANAGVIPRTIEFILGRRVPQSSISVSCIEVYNESVFDLLAAQRTEVKIRMHPEVCLVGVTEKPLRSMADMYSILLASDRNRRVAATQFNKDSSRSHVITVINLAAEFQGSATQSKLYLVDLAGSERATDSTLGDSARFAELKAINGSLSALQRCLRTLHSKGAHVPYRESALTAVLSPALGAGHSKTLVLVAVNPDPMQVAETQRSLKFAHLLCSTSIKGK